MPVLAIFTGPYGWLAKWGVIALLVLSFGAFAWFKGYSSGKQKLFDYQAKQALEAVRIAKAQEKVTTEVVTKYVRVRGATEVVTRTVEKEVIRYAEVNSGYCLDPAWRWLHDDAASNRVPNPRLKPDGEGGAPKASEALQTITENYAACHRTADRLDALQSWIKKQQDIR